MNIVIIETLNSLDHNIKEIEKSIDILSRHPESEKLIKDYLTTLTVSQKSKDYLVKLYIQKLVD